MQGLFVEKLRFEHAIPWVLILKCELHPLTPSFHCTCKQCNFIIKWTNWTWLSTVCTLIDNDIHHCSGQNVVDSQGAAEWIHNKFWLLWWRISLLIRVQTTLNHTQFVFTTIFNVKDDVYFREWPRSWHKERASVVYNFFAICLVHFPNWAFLIGYYNCVTHWSEQHCLCLCLLRVRLYPIYFQTVILSIGNPLTHSPLNRPYLSRVHTQR